MNVREVALERILVNAGLDAACGQKELATAQRLFEDDNRPPLDQFDMG